jgi:hypothetical protein
MSFIKLQFKPKCHGIATIMYNSLIPFANFGSSQYSILKLIAIHNLACSYVISAVHGFKLQLYETHTLFSFWIILVALKRAGDWKCRLVATLDRIRRCVFGFCRSSLGVSCPPPLLWYSVFAANSWFPRALSPGLPIPCPLSQWNPSKPP